ncbi:perlucin-like protein [Saccoglossus kowalevskii]
MGLFGIVIVVLTVTSASTTALLTECPRGWTEWQDHCYYCFLEPKTWEDADTICKNYNGYLASIHSRQENDKINEVCASLFDLWIGYNDKGWEGIWTWSDSTAVEYTNWESGQPDGESGLIDGDVSCAMQSNELLIPLPGSGK